MSHHESIIGKTFGKLQVIKLDHISSMIYKPKDGSNPYNINREYYLCKCECGQLCVKVYNDLIKYPDISCGCNHIKKTYKDVRIGMLVGTGKRKRMGNPLVVENLPLGIGNLSVIVVILYGKRISRLMLTRIICIKIYLQIAVA